MSGDRFSLAGKTAFVTGASSGLGRHFATVLSEAGANVALAARRIDRIQELSDSLNAGGARAMAVELDVTDPASVDAAVEKVASELGPINVLVNNAGVARSKRFVDLTEEDWAYVLDTNLTGAWRVAQRVARQMLEHGGGSIVNIASILAIGVGPAHAAYAASKAGLAHLTKSMATELFKHNIRVNAICPSYFPSEMTEEFFASGAGQLYLTQIPPKRLGELHELDGPLLLLASDASSFMTGTLIPVDGGHSIRLM